MDPAVIYILLFTMAVSICCGAFFAWRPPSRACQMCGKETSMQQKRCIHCGYVTNR
jgi:hypothetical protein